MRAIVLESTGELRERDAPEPRAGAGEVVVAVEACGVCRTDLHVLDGELPDPATPLILGQMSQMMMRPSAQIVRRYGIPADVLREAYDRNPKHRAQTGEAVAKVRKLCRELGIITPRTVKLWKAVGLWPREEAPV